MKAASNAAVRLIDLFYSLVFPEPLVFDRFGKDLNSQILVPSCAAAMALHKKDGTEP
ncbi:MAG: hypothetical protein IJL15_06110 [Clostridia bacterium]|nr:hypothetical protein [Clostridia bacterium]